jgi:hypothetical protein
MKTMYAMCFEFMCGFGIMENTMFPFCCLIYWADIYLYHCCNRYGFIFCNNFRIIQQRTAPIQTAPALASSAPPRLAPTCCPGYGAKPAGADLASFGATALGAKNWTITRTSPHISSAPSSVAPQSSSSAPSFFGAEIVQFRVTFPVPNWSSRRVDAKTSWRRR